MKVWETFGFFRLLKVVVDCISNKIISWYELWIFLITLVLYIFNRELGNVNGHVKFQNHYGRVHVQLTGSCGMWRSDVPSEDGGWLSSDVFVDIIEQKWHANLKVVNIFAPVRYIV